MGKEYLFSITKKDLIVQAFRSGGKGGQHQNKVSTGIRIIHPSSGAVGISRTERSQYQNKKNALYRLVHSVKFKVWVNRMVIEHFSEEDIVKKIDKMMEPHNLKIESRNKNGKLVDYKEE